MEIAAPKAEENQGMEGKSILNRNISEIAQMLDEEYCEVLLRNLIQMFDGPPSALFAKIS